MTNKALFVANRSDFIQKFLIPQLQYLKRCDYEIHVASNGEIASPLIDKLYNIPIQRQPLSLGNIHAYQKIKEVIGENDYSFIHCHTPMGGVLTRLAAKKSRKNGTRVIYTAHGFHFYDGAPAVNWMIYYTIEKLLARHTDYLITINQEDYALASQKFNCPDIRYIRGVGVNMKKFHPVSREEKCAMRQKFGYREDDFLIIYVAELNRNKNQAMLIDTMSRLKKEAPGAKLLLVGDDSGEMQGCRNLSSQLGVENAVHFLGYRSDVKDIYPMCDLSVSTSCREGLPVNVMESLACGLPVIATDIRGHRDLIQDGKNGYLFPVGDAEGFSGKIAELYHSPGAIKTMSAQCLELIRPFSLDSVGPAINSLYASFLADEGMIEGASYV